MKGEERAVKRGSILDVLLVLLAVLCLLGLVWRHQMIRRAETDGNTVSVTLTAGGTVSGLDTVSCLSVGEPLYTESGEYFGRLTSVSVTRTKAVLLANGTYYEGEWDIEERCDLTVEIETEGQLTKNGCLHIGGRTALSQSLPTLYSRRASLHLVLYKMSATKAE